MYLPPEGYTALVPRFEIDGAAEGRRGRRGAGNDRSGVVKIERADRESPAARVVARDRASERAGAERSRADEWLGRKYTDYSCSLGVGLPAAARNMVIAARNPGRRVAGGRWRNSSNEDDPRHSGNPVHVMGRGGDGRFSPSLEHLDLLYAWI